MSPTFVPLDDFDRPDGPLGPDWLDYHTFAPMLIESGSVVPGFFFNGAAYIPGAAGGLALNINNPGSPNVRLGASIGDIFITEGGGAGGGYIWPGYYATWGSSVCTILQIAITGIDLDTGLGTPIPVQTELASEAMGVPVGPVQLAIFVEGDLVTAYIDGVPVLSAVGLGGPGIGGPDNPPHVAFFLGAASAGSAGLYIKPPGGISLSHALADTLLDGPPGVTPVGISLNAKLLAGA